MTPVQRLPGVTGSTQTLDEVIATHGAWRVLRAAVRALVSANRAPPRLYVDQLPEYLQRDVGVGAGLPEILAALHRH